MSGHVFLVHGDLLRLHCDAWLLPTDPDLVVEPEWRREGSGRDLPLPDDPRGTWPASGPRVARVPVRGRPEPWLVDVVGDGSDVPTAAVAGARAFLQAAAARFGGVAAYTRRARPLLALPVVGTGDAPGRRTTGALLARLLGALWSEAAALSVDVALVCLEAPVFAAAQEVRRREGASFGALGGSLVDEARRLVDRSEGRPVLFLGAGVSAGAGLPLWDALLDEVADGVVPDGERADFRALAPLDRARILARRLGDELVARVAARVTGRHHALSHALLAGLPVTEAVTTNYDVLFEYASAGAGRPVRVLPFDRPEPDGRWLLKLHGCILRNPDQIVLTREDSLRYADRHAALAGIVQSLLVTRHMLFVGFSLHDDTFHRIADAVRRSVPAGDTERFGTVVDLFDNPLEAELWAGDLHTVSMAPRGTRDADAARRLEVFLDAVSAFATRGTPYLLDARFSGLRTGPEEALAARLETLAGVLDDTVRATAAGERVARMLRELGYDRPFGARGRGAG